MGVSRRDLNRQRTIEDIERAFLDRYKQAGIDGVSISDICQTCGVSRSTFYLYFEDKYAVLQQAEDRLLARLWELCGQLPDVLGPDEVSDNAASTIDHIRENMAWYQALLGTHGDPMFVYRWKRDIADSLRKKLSPRNLSEQDATIRGVVFASALIGLYTHVIFECPDISDAQLGRYMESVLEKFLK